MYTVVYLHRNETELLPVDRTSCLACEYDASCAAFTTIALATVGKQPYIRHRIAYSQTVRK